jgi:hypothetical protein
MRGLQYVVACCLVLCAALSVAGHTTESTTFPLATLLEHTAIIGDKWAPTPRTRLEKLQLTQSPRVPEFLGAKVDQIMYQGADSIGHSEDSTGNKREHAERSQEPQSNHFGDLTPPPEKSFVEQEQERAPRGTCSGKTCAKDTNEGPISLPPSYVPPPPGPKRPSPPKVPKNPEHLPFPEAPPPELPLATPPKPDCGELCSPNAKDPLLARIPAPPLNDFDIATVGLEGTVLAKVMQKLRNREGWLRAQKLWLSKAVEAASTVRREIELAEFTKDAVASELEHLKIAQDALSIKYKADRLKWSFKDKKMTLEELRERLEALEHAKADVAHQIREAKDEVTILENTLGPPSQQVQISPSELEDPLKFLDDVIAEHNYNLYD